MYEESQWLIQTNSDTYNGNFYLLPTNGSYVRDGRGKIYSEVNEEGVYYRNIAENNFFSGIITNQVINERIKFYLQNYYGRKYTNCSTFANFLITGQFLECEEEKNCFVLTEHMTILKNTHRFKVGDMVCIFYANDKHFKSRGNGLRSNYLKLKKNSDKGKNFGLSLEGSKSPIFSPDRLLNMCLNILIKDYHFMVCVDVKNEIPVWLSQLGAFKPGERPTSFALSKGLSNLYQPDMPILSLIKKSS